MRTIQPATCKVCFKHHRNPHDHQFPIHPASIIKPRLIFTPDCQGCKIMFICGAALFHFEQKTPDRLPERETTSEWIAGRYGYIVLTILGFRPSPLVKYEPTAGTPYQS